MRIRSIVGSTVIAASFALFAIAPAGQQVLGKGANGKTSSGTTVTTTPVRARQRMTAVAAPTASGFDAERLFGTGDDWEPDIQADPSSNYVYMATTRYGGAKACTRCPSPAIILKVSSDGGATWGADTYLCACSGIKAQNDPEIEVSSNGTVFATWMNDYNPGIVFSKSTNHGSTWSAPVTLKGKGLSFTDKPIMTVNSNGQDLFIAFNSSDSYIVASHNGGTTWSTRYKTNTDTRYYFAEGGVVAPNGNIYFSGSAENQNATGQVNLVVVKSANNGTSWTQSTVDVSEQQPACTVTNCGADFYASQADIAVDASGKLALLYTANSAAGANKTLYLKTSTDGGATWGARSIVSSQGDANDPKIDNGPTAGDFRVAWADNRGGAFNTYYKRTIDGGATWAAEKKLSDQTSGATYKSAAGYTFPYGDYFGFATNASGVNFAAWGEGPNYDGPGGTWYTKGQ